VATTRCPLTLDHEMLLAVRRRSRFRSSGEGSDGARDGLATAVNRMRASNAKSKVVVLVTDGGTTAGQLGPSRRRMRRALWVSRCTRSASGRKGRCPASWTTRRRAALHRGSADFDESALKSIASTTGRALLPRRRRGRVREGVHEIDGSKKRVVRAACACSTRKNSWRLVPAGLLLGFELSASRDASEEDPLMRFAEPGILWALLAVPLLRLLFVYGG
jgi:Ca-activated chloride channel family protein